MKRVSECKGNKAKRPSNFKKGQPKTKWPGVWKQPSRSKKESLSKSEDHLKHLKKTLSKKAFAEYKRKWNL